MPQSQQTDSVLRVSLFSNNIWIVAPIKRAVDDGTAKELMGDAFKRRLLMDGRASNTFHLILPAFPWPSHYLFLDPLTACSLTLSPPVPCTPTTFIKSSPPNKSPTNPCHRVQFRGLHLHANR